MYNFAIFTYKFAISIAALFNKKAKQRIVGLRNNEAILRKIKTEKSTSKNWQLAWFHAASLGEFEQARPVLEAFKSKNSSYKILVTFFSPSGFEIRKNYSFADFVLYLPFDLKADAEEFTSIIEPTIVFWVKYEYWRNFLKLLSKRKTPVYLFSAIFRENQPFFKWYSQFFTEPLRSFSHLFVQDDDSKYLLNSIGIENVTVAGDTRFDRVADTLKMVREIEVVKRFKANRKLLVFGSAWEEDVKYLHFLPDGWRGEVGVVIAPHELRDSQIARWRKEFNGVKFSEVNQESSLASFDVLIVDNIGLLASIYQYADFAFIGGAFGKGLHNILEAATFGMPIFFGNKNYKKFKEAVDLLVLGGAFAVADGEEFTDEFRKQLHNSEAAKTITARYVQQQTGATEVILEFVSEL